MLPETISSNFCCSWVVRLPLSPWLMGLLSNVVIGVISTAVPVKKASSELTKSSYVRFSSLTLKPRSFAIAITDWRVIPFRQLSGCWS